MANLDIVEFLKTIYLGDRGCKSILLDGWNSEVKIQVTCISRVREATWNYYTAEDLPDGFMVFEGVNSVTFEPCGPLPNSFISDIHAVPLVNDRAKYLVIMSADANDPSDPSGIVSVKVMIRADSMALEDQRKPGQRITR